MMSRALLFAALLLIPAVVHAESAAEKAEFEPRLTIYLARGPANACGPGCDRWIAVEGDVDRDAAPRIRRFLLKIKDKQRPIYFHSPGGSVEPSLVIGRLLRSRKAVARVGRTIVADCAAGTQFDEACLKVKNGGGEVRAEIVTRNAMCNSACAYMLLGAATREIAPDAVIAVHNSRYTVVFQGHPSALQVANFKHREIAEANRERASFIAAMGIHHELNDLIKTVKFESFHVLTRPELYDFGIDTRLSAETAWMLQAAARPYIRKILFAKTQDGAAFRMMEWRLFCENKDHARLMFIREFDPAAAGKTTMVMMAGAQKSVAFGAFPVRIGKYEVWSDKVAPDALKTMLAAPGLAMGEGTSAPAGNASLVTFDIDTSGLPSAWTQLLQSCPAPATVAWPATIAPHSLAPVPAH